MPRAALRFLSLSLAVSLAGTALLPAAPAFADPPPHARGQARSHKGSGGNISIAISISDHDRRIAREYYGSLVARGHCPPGLAKKNNGCMPPGQAKKWALGRPLPRDVIFHDLPHDLRIRMSVPPDGYRYVRVATDILLIAVGTGLVVGAIEDLMSAG